MILGVLDDILDRPPAQKLAALLGVVLAVVILDWQYWYGGNQRQLPELHGEPATRPVRQPTSSAHKLFTELVGPPLDPQGTLPFGE